MQSAPGRSPPRWRGWGWRRSCRWRRPPTGCWWRAWWTSPRGATSCSSDDPDQVQVALLLPSPCVESAYYRFNTSVPITGGDNLFNCLQPTPSIVLSNSTLHCLPIHCKTLLVCLLSCILQYCAQFSCWAETPLFLVVMSPNLNSSANTNNVRLVFEQLAKPQLVFTLLNFKLPIKSFWNTILLPRTKNLCEVHLQYGKQCVASQSTLYQLIFVLSIVR